MSVKFFGQYLIEQGEIDAGQLREAVELIRRTNLSVGEIAVQERILSGRDAVRVNAQQRHQDRPFGELAVEMGLLSEEQLEKVLDKQRRSRLFLGQALVQLGHLDGNRLEGLLDDYKLDQAAYEDGSMELPEWLADSAVAAAVVNLVPKFCMRLARMHAKIAEGATLGRLPDHEVSTRVVVRGDENLEITLLADREFCLHVAAGVSGLKRDDVAEYLIRDGVCEFLNILSGNATSMLERKGYDLRFGPAEPQTRPSTGYLFEVLVSAGQAWLVLAKA